MPNRLLPDADIDPAFRARLRNRVLVAHQNASRQTSLFDWRILVPATGVALVLLLLGVSPSLAPTQEPLADFTRVEQVLAAVDEELAGEQSLMVAAASAEEVMDQAHVLEGRLATYIAKLSNIISLLEQLIVRLETAGHDASVAQQRLTEAKQRLAAAESLAALPVQCLEALAITDDEVDVARCDVPLEETRQELGSVVGLLRTSVSSAKSAL